MRGEEVRGGGGRGVEEEEEKAQGRVTMELDHLQSVTHSDLVEMYVIVKAINNQL